MMNKKSNGLLLLLIFLIISDSVNAIEISVSIDATHKIDEVDESNNMQSIDFNIITTKNITLAFRAVDKNVDENFNRAVLLQSEFFNAVYPFAEIVKEINETTYNTKIPEGQNINAFQIFHILNSLRREYGFNRGGARTNEIRIIGVLPKNWFLNRGRGESGITDFFQPTVLIEEQIVSGVAHEIGHTYNFCDEYSFCDYQVENLKLSLHPLMLSCANPFPTSCPNFQCQDFLPITNCTSLGVPDLNGFWVEKNKEIKTNTKYLKFNSLEAAEDWSDKNWYDEWKKGWQCSQPDEDYSITCKFIYYSFMGSADLPNNRWSSKTMYNYLLKIFRETFQPQMLKSNKLSSSLSSHSILVSGLVDKNGWVGLEEFYLIEGEPTEDIPSGDYSLKLLDVNETILLDQNFWVSFTLLADPPIDLNTSGFVFSVPFVDGTQKIAIDFNGLRRAERIVSSSPPAVSITSPAGGEEWSAIHTISWTGSDADGDTLSYVLQYSSDDGNTWNPLAIDVNEESYELNAAYLTPGENYRVKVIATDGVLTGEAVSGTFTVRNPDIDLQPSEWEFGTVAQGAIVSRDFNILNIGNANLEVTAISSDSEIIVSGIFLPITIAPGASESFNADLNTAGLSYEIVKEIVISSNDPNESNRRIRVEGTVEPPVPVVNLSLTMPSEVSFDENFSLNALIEVSDVELRDANVLLILPAGLDSAGPLNVFLGDIPAGESRSLEWELSASHAGIFEVIVVVYSDNAPSVSETAMVSVKHISIEGWPEYRLYDEDDNVTIKAYVTNYSVDVSYLDFDLNAVIISPSAEEFRSGEHIDMLQATETRDASIDWNRGEMELGIYNVEVTLYGSGGALLDSFTASFEVILPMPPVLDPIGPQTATEKEPFELQVTAFDPNRDELVFSDDTDFFDINSHTGLISFTPTQEHVGIWDVNISVSDGIFTDSEIVTFTIINVNDAPSFDIVEPLIAIEGEEFNLQLNALDPDGDALTYAAYTDSNTNRQIDFSRLVSGGLYGRYYDDIDGKSPDIIINYSSYAGIKFDEFIDKETNEDFGGAGLTNYDYFGVVWDGFIYIPTNADDYIFYISSNTGGRLYLNGNKIIEDWNGEGADEKVSAPLILTEGHHSIKMEYYERTGKNEIMLKWSSTSAGIEKQIIPPDVLYDRYLLFDVNPATGFVSFTPADEDVGDWIVEFSVTDGEYSDKQIIPLTVFDNSPIVEATKPSNELVSGITPIEFIAGDADLNELSASVWLSTSPQSYESLIFSGIDLIGSENCIDVNTFPVLEHEGLTLVPGGLYGYYFDNSIWDDPTLEIDYNSYISAKLDSEIYKINDADFIGAGLSDYKYFGVVWDGFIHIPTDADDYIFYAYSDDGSYLYIDGELVVDNWGKHSARERASDKLTLSEGLHQIKIEYAEITSSNKIRIKWKSDSAGIDKQIIPSNALYSQVGIKKRHCSFDWDSLHAADGDYFIDAEVFDGQSSSIDSSESFTADNTEPAIELISPPDGSSIEPGTIIDLNISDLHLRSAWWSKDSGDTNTLFTWWDQSYSYKKPILIEAADLLDSGYTIELEIDSASLISAGKMLNNCDDLRVVDSFYNEELDRNVINCNSANTIVEFKLQRAIDALATSTDYYLYYGNPLAGTAPSNLNEIYELWDNFDDGDFNSNPAWDIGAGTWAVTNGAIRTSVSGSQYNLISSHSFSGDYLYSVDVNFNAPDLDSGLIFNIKDNGNHYLLALREKDHSSPDMQLYKRANDYYYSLYTPVPGGTDIFSSGNSYNIKIVVNNSTNTYKFYVDDVFKGEYTHTTYTLGKVGFRTHRNTETYFDNAKLIKFVQNPPAISLGEEELASYNINTADWQQKNVQLDVWAADLAENLAHKGYSFTFPALNAPPTIDSYSPLTNPTIYAGQSQQFSITKSDPDEDILTVEWYLNDSLVLNDQDSYTYAADYNSAGIYDVNVVVSDGELDAIHHWLLTVGEDSRDSDRDGFLDETETAVGTDSQDPGSYPFGSALGFDGVDDVVTLPGFDAQLPLTLEMWVQPHGSPFSVPAEQVWFSAADADEATALAFGYWNGNIAAKVMGEELHSGVSLPNRKWTHVSFAVTESNVLFYVNGVLEATVPHSIVSLPSNLDWVLGAEAQAENYTLFTKAYLDEVRLWSRERSGEEISADYKERLAGNKLGLLAHWNFNEGAAAIAGEAGQTVFDYTARYDGYLGTSPEVDAADPEWSITFDPIEGGYHPADKGALGEEPRDWDIGDFEILGAIDVWAAYGRMSGLPIDDFEILDIIDYWAAYGYHWDEAALRWQEGTEPSSIPADIVGDRNALSILPELREELAGGR